MEEGKKWCVYIHRNMINNKAYIGITCQDPENRWGNNGCRYTKCHADGSYEHPVFAKAIQKYGWDNFEHIIWANNLAEDEAKAWEVRLIALFKTNCSRYKNPEYGYNLTDGGEGMRGYTLSEEAKEKISKANSGKKWSEKRKNEISEAMKGENNPMFGKHCSEETKQKISEANKGKQKWLGKHHSDKSKKKQSESAKARCTDEWKKESSKRAKERFSIPENNPMFGKHHSDETKEKIRKSRQGKPGLKGKDNPCYGSGMHVIQLSMKNNYIAEYVSADEAEQITGVNASSIRNCCKHKPHCKTAGGFKWMFKDEYEQLKKYN